MQDFACLLLSVRCFALAGFDCVLLVMFGALLRILNSQKSLYLTVCGSLNTTCDYMLNGSDY